MESDRIKRSRFTYIARRNQVSRKLNVEMHIHNRVVTALMLSVGGFASRRLLLLSTLLVWTQDSRISSKLYISFIFKREKTFTDSYNISWSPSALKSRQGTDKGRQQRSKPPNHQICGKRVVPLLLCGTMTSIFPAYYKCSQMQRCRLAATTTS